MLQVSPQPGQTPHSPRPPQRPPGPPGHACAAFRCTGSRQAVMAGRPRGGHVARPEEGQGSDTGCGGPRQDPGLAVPAQEPRALPGPSPPTVSRCCDPGLDAPPPPGSQPPERPAGDSRGRTRPASPLRSQDRPTGSCPHVRLWAQAVRGGAQPGDRAQLPRVTHPGACSTAPGRPQRGVRAPPGGRPAPDRSQGPGPWLHPPEPPAPRGDIPHEGGVPEARQPSRGKP